MISQPNAANADASPYEVISFLVGDQEFCVNVMGVREIRGWSASTTLPHAPDYVLGVINLRGAVLPVIDLSSRLGLGRTEPSRSDVVIVVQTQGMTVGLMVHAVCDIIVLTPDMVQRPPVIDGTNSGDMVVGIVPMDNRMVTLLSLDHVIPDKPLLAA